MRARWISAAIAALGAVCLASMAQAQDYPNRFVKIVNPYVAGSTTDVLARALAFAMTSRLGREVIVENRPGAGGAVGTASVIRSGPDGYNLLFIPALIVSVLPQARNDTGYTPDALVPICQTFVNAMALVVRPDSPIKNVTDLIAAAEAKPGTMNYGHQGLLTIPHLAMEELLLTADIDIKGIPFRGDPLVMTDLLGGRLDVASLVLGTVGGQNVRVIGLFSDTRHSSVPTIPTIKEQGYDVSSASFGGLFAPAGTPAPILARLGTACAEAAKDNVYMNAARNAAQPADYYADADAFRQRLNRDIESKARVLAKVAK